MKSHLALVIALFSIFISGCARYKYHPAPISPPALAATLYQRSLDDPGLRSWMNQSAGFEPPSWPLKTWDLTSLTLAAFYFSPDLDVARANAASADAKITTAGMKPNPTISIGPGYQSPPDSQFIMGFNFDLPIETAGKRGYRIESATHLSRATRLQLAQAAWTVRSRVRATSVDYLFALKTADQIRQQLSLQERYAGLIDKRFRAGEISLPELTTAQIDLTNLRQTLRAAEGQVHTTHAALAAAMGIPDEALAGKELIWPGIDEPPAPGSLPPQSMREAAVENRLDVERALEQYEAAQSNLQLEVARQYPDIHLGPGYNYEEGAHFIALDLSSVLPVRSHNEGPIAEAEAQRKTAGAQLLATQSGVIADTYKAMAQYNAAYSSLEQVQLSVSQLEKQQQAAEKLENAGETDRLTVISAGLQSAIAQRARLDAEHQAQVSLGLLEDALERPIAPATAPTLPKQSPR
ncbi:MAG: TolC family protein [Acidobacteriota bacterium]|nr:TolC family protein [Acidobacteriota bacterium]